MASLIAKSPSKGLLPVEAGGCVLTETPMQPVWAIMPYSGSAAALSKAMTKAHGIGFPEPNTLLSKGDIHAAWSGMDQAFLVGTDPSDKLSKHAALVDQSDAWTHLQLSGTTVAEVLARLVPVDMSTSAMPVGTSLRSSIGHMSALIFRTAEDRIDLMVFRSMAGTAVHELERAMRAIAARATL